MLPPYNAAPICMKCGADGVSTRYHRLGAPDMVLYVSVTPPPCADAVQDLSGEHLDRVCCTCGYIWPEACLAAPHDHTWSEEVDYADEHPGPRLYYARCLVTGCDARLARPDPLAGLPYRVKRAWDR